MGCMRTIFNPSLSQWKQLAERPTVRRSELRETVEKMFDDIQQNGDKAVLKFGKQFDYSAQTSLIVDVTTIQNATDRVSEELKTAIETARQNIEKFHASQQEKMCKIEMTAGVVCWRESRPIERIGIYIPGGSAPLFSTVLMLAVPAQIAGCKEVVLCTPPDANGEINPAILYTANLVGVTKIFSVGGIQAIGALTFGTETIPKVDKIFGPGNQYVTAAKQVAQYYNTAIDMPAGPSEVLVIADASCRPSFVAADLLSQAEHGADSQVILLSTSKQIIEEIQQELDTQLARLARKEIARQALENSRAILFDTVDECLVFSNLYAPEHLILAVENPESVSRKVINAGSVFLGNFSCESAGDYASGTNHTLPTSGYARAYSGVSLDSFVKKITFQHLTEEGIKNIGNAVEIMAEAEELLAHKNAVSIRLQEIKKQNNDTI